MKSLSRRSRAAALTALIFATQLVARAGETEQSATQPTESDMQRTLREFQARIEALERQHAEEHARDQARIDELESNVRELQTRAQGAEQDAIEAARRDALAQQIAEIRAELSVMNSRGRQVGAPPASQASGAEAELEGLLGGTASAATTPAAAPGGGAMTTLQSAIQSMNPEISLNGDFLAAYSNREGGRIDDEFLFRELEIGFAGAVDPYTRADVIATIAREDGDFAIDLEEAYLTFLQLPYGLQARLGKYRAEFGRANPIHLHALPWIDYPFVIRRFFGEEGLSGTGGELSWVVPNPWKQYVALTYQLFNNDNDVIFAGRESDDFTHLVRLKTFRDLSSESTLEMGGSFATAPNDAGHGSHRSMIEGLDVTYRWKPKGEGLYRSMLWQNEALFAQADIRGGQESTWGMYSALEYQFARQWKIGARYDNTQLPFSSSHFERGYSAYLTFLQSEFVFWRLAYLIRDRNFHEDGNRNEQQVMLQLNFTLGAHPAHRY
ncbi:MAG: hypothetical protein U1D55_03835 [Phycisphaerae bacterium]